MGRHLNGQQGRFAVGAMLGAAGVGDGPTPEQTSVIAALAHGYFGLPGSESFDPVAPDEMADAIESVDGRRRMRELLVLVEMCRHPLDPEQVVRVEHYVDHLDADDDTMVLARDLVAGGRDEATGDFLRFFARETRRMEEPSLAGRYTQLEEPDPVLAARLRALAEGPEESLGRAYVDFYRRWDLELPGDSTISPSIFVSHDMSHVIAGYEPEGVGEICLGAMQLAIDDSDAHWYQWLGNLLIHEAGSFERMVVAKRASLARPGAATALAEAFQRGSACTGDFSIMDHLALAEEPLDGVRERFAVPPLAPGPDWVAPTY